MEATETLLLLRCEQALHAGTGLGVGAIDKPIQRDKSTTLPIIFDSAVKGSIKSKARESKKVEDVDDFSQMFGSDNDGSVASSAVFTEAHILLFPVRSARGLFTWVTCPFVLNRFLLKGHRLNRLEQFTETIDDLDKDDIAFLLSDNFDACAVVKAIPEEVEGRQELKFWSVLEDLCFEVNKNLALRNVSSKIADMLFDKNEEQYWHNHLKNNLILVSNNVFKYYAKYAVEIRTRNKIDINTNTAGDTSLFVVECLPEMSVLYTAVSVFHEKATAFTETYINPLTATKLQTGGSYTTGKGQLNVRMA